MSRINLIIFALLISIASFAKQFEERILLTTDQDSYLTGEIIHFKVITTDLQQVPVDFSKVVYVDLSSGNGSEMQLMIPLKQGVGYGTMQLPSSLRTGWYRITAYTRYMRNQHVESFATKYVPVVNPDYLSARNIRTGTRPTLNPAFNRGSIGVRTDRQSYAPGTNAELNLRNIPDNVKTLSITITAEDIKTESHGISPMNYYQANKSEERFQAEYEGHIITLGLVSNTVAAPVNMENMQLFLSVVGEGPNIYHGRKTKNGKISFNTGIGTGNRDIVIVSDNEREKNFFIEIESPFAQLPVFDAPVLIIDSTSIDQITMRHLSVQSNEIFNINQSDTLHLPDLKPNFRPDRSYLLDEYTRFSTMEEVIVEFVAGVRFRRVEGARKMVVNTKETDGFSLGNSLILIDNVPVFNHDLLLAFDPFLIEKIDVYTYKFVFGERFFEGIVSFNTYKKDLEGFKIDDNTSILAYRGLDPIITAGNFTSADEEKSKNTPDFRNVLLWIPDVDVTSGTVTIPFRTSGLKGRYRILTEGYTNDGQHLRSTGYFEIK